MQYIFQIAISPHRYGKNETHSKQHRTNVKPSQVVPFKDIPRVLLTQVGLQIADCTQLFLYKTKAQQIDGARL